MPKSQPTPNHHNGLGLNIKGVKPKMLTMTTALRRLTSGDYVLVHRRHFPVTTALAQILELPTKKDSTPKT